MTRSRELAELASAYDSGSSLGFRNRIINGDMRVNQRGFSSSSGIANGTYTVDRWQYRGTGFMVSLSTNTDAPNGFRTSINMVPFEPGTPGASEYYSLVQRIEGFNIADLGLGTANAVPITVSFWVKSNLTGTFGGSLEFDMGTYVFGYTITAANTWEQKFVTFTGLSSALCVPASVTNGTGLVLNLTAGAGSSRVGAVGLSSSYFYSVTGATNFLSSGSNYIRFSGVQLEAGTVATPFERRDYGRELAMCQRYYWRAVSGASYTSWGTVNIYNGTLAQAYRQFPVTMRAIPSTFEFSSAGSYKIDVGASAYTLTAIGNNGNYISPNAMVVDMTAGGGGMTAGQAGQLANLNNTTNYIGVGAEL